MIEGVITQSDVPFLLPEREERLDLYLPADRAAGTCSPGIVIIHGGGWIGGSKSAPREIEIGTTLARAGYVCASIEYRLSEQERWPTNLFDCKNAVRFLRTQADTYGIDVDNLGVIGGSAGGHLSLLVAYTAGLAALDPPTSETPYPGVPDSVKAVVDLYGISDIRTRKKVAPDGTPAETRHDKSAAFGDKEPISDIDRALASPVEHIRPDSPPTLILHGTHDLIVDRDQSVQLDEALTAAGVPHQRLMVPEVGHTFDLENQSNGQPLPLDLRPTVIEFFNRYLKR